MIESLTFITGNLQKAEQLSKYLGISIDHKQLDLPEIQSLELTEVIEQKAREAFIQMQTPVVVDDVAFIIQVFGKLPGPFIKFFLSEIGNEKLCQMMQLFNDRSAIAIVAIGYCDGKTTKVFTGEINGTIADRPKGINGFGWDSMIIPEGHTKTRAEMKEAEYDATSPRKKALEKLEIFLRNSS